MENKKFNVTIECRYRHIVTIEGTSEKDAAENLEANLMTGENVPTFYDESGDKLIWDSLLVTHSEEKKDVTN